MLGMLFMLFISIAGIGVGADAGAGAGYDPNAGAAPNGDGYYDADFKDVE